MHSCISIVVTAPERLGVPSKVRVPSAVATTKIDIPEKKPKFEMRILEERGPLMHTHDNDDWYTLLDVDTNESGTVSFVFLHVECCWFLTNAYLWVSLRHQRKPH